MRWTLLLALPVCAWSGSVHAYPPPPLDCPNGQRGEIGGYCVPMSCTEDTRCEDQCFDRDGLDSLICQMGSTCGTRTMCVKEVSEMEAGPYPTRYVVDTCGNEPDCLCDTLPVCVVSGARIVRMIGMPLLALIAISMVVAWRMRRRAKPPQG